LSNSSARICFDAGLSCADCGTCASSTECDDYNPCTIDECDGDPLMCKHKLILWCRDGDGCCPESRCTEDNDMDCQKAAADCINYSDCSDNNASTQDLCEVGICTNNIITECASDDNYCPEGCDSDSDGDCDDCSSDSDCDDDYACTIDTCRGAPKKCSNEVISGCDFNSTCISPGTRKQGQFCHDSMMKPLKPKKEFCVDDYECLSALCKKNKCKNLSFVTKIGNWFQRLFGN